MFKVVLRDSHPFSTVSVRTEIGSGFVSASFKAVIHLIQKDVRTPVYRTVGVLHEAPQEK